MSDANPRISYIREKLGSKVLEIHQAQGDDVLLVDRSGLRASFLVLKTDTQLGYDFLSDITAVDYWQKKEPRFEVVYQILSVMNHQRLDRFQAPERDPTVESLTPLWRGANFLEREVWD